MGDLNFPFASMLAGIAVALLMFFGLASGARAGGALEIAQTLCIACHGPDGNSPDPANPKIAGLDPAYIARQLQLFASGTRRSEIMTPIASALSGSDIRELAEHFAKFKPHRGKVADTQLASAGRVIFRDGDTDSGAPSCEGCHLPNGAGNSRFPRLAGQHQAYVERQMLDFKSGARTTNRLMNTVGQRLTAAEIKAVAEYIAGLPEGEAD
jgi:cytochrome c553